MRKTREINVTFDNFDRLDTINDIQKEKKKQKQRQAQTVAAKKLNLNMADVLQNKSNMSYLRSLRQTFLKDELYTSYL